VHIKGFLAVSLVEPPKNPRKPVVDFDVPRWKV